MNDSTNTPKTLDTPIRELLAAAKRPLLSYEFFPPKSGKAEANLKRSIEVLRETQPDFVTITYGAGGSTREKTRAVAGWLREAGLGPVMPHLTCVGSSQQELREIADELHADGYRNIMTLRGDPPQGKDEFVPAPDGFAYANQLVELLKERHDDFCLGVAGYPENHPESDDTDSDIRHLKTKVDAGACFVTTQLFFDNQVYFDFVDRCRAAGITIPILPGLLPATSLKQVSRFADMCGASFPPELRDRMAAAGSEGRAAEDAGIDWCLEQIQGLFEGGAPGVHLYVLNRSRAPLQLLRRGFA